jgi:hypothetical protein
VTFVEHETEVVEGLGAVCRRALFVPDAATTMPVGAGGVGNAGATAIDVLGDERTDDEASKMTKSIVSFRAHHKRWRAPPSTQRVLASLAAFADHVDVDADDDADADADADANDNDSARGRHPLDQQRDPFERLQTSILMPPPRRRRAPVPAAAAASPRKDTTTALPATSTARRRFAASTDCECGAWWRVRFNCVHSC